MSATATLARPDAPPRPLPATWTAMEFCAALAPHLYSTLADPKNALAPLTRRAHATALLEGCAWSPTGHYPISVWSAVLSEQPSLLPTA
jgi:hypothetical protein